MKNQTLSISQMRHLQELGVDTSKASMVLIAKDGGGNEVCWEDLSFKEDSGTWLCESWDDELDEPCEKEAYLSYIDAENGDYDHSYRDTCSVFTLQDIIELLPESIECYEQEYKLFLDKQSISYVRIEYEDWYYLFDVDEDRKSVYEDEYSYNYSGKKTWFDTKKSLLECAYETLCWVAENGYLKKEGRNDKD